MTWKKRNILFLGLGLALMNCRNISALTLQELNNYMLDVHSERYEGTDRIEEFLKKNGVDISEYREYIEELNKYSESYEFLWERIENGSILIDEVLFSDEEIKTEYEKALKALGSERLAYDFVKKNMLNSPDIFISKFDIAMKDLEKVRSAFEQKFNKKPCDLEAMWLESLDTVKYALYMGANGEYLTQQHIDSIDENKGYEVFGLTEDDIKKYMEFTEERDKYDNIILSYVKSYSMFESIYTDIISKYGKDIYTSLTDDERLSIYNKSIKGFIFDEKVAKEKVVDLLISKKILTKDDLLEEDKDDFIEQEMSTGNPWNELKYHMENNSSLTSKFQLLSSLYNSKGVSAVFEDLSDEFIYIKYKDKDINTHIRLSDDNKLKESFVKELIEILKEEIGIKVVFSRNEILTLFENEIKTFDLSLNEEDGIEFNRLVQIFKKLGIDLYLKNINYNEISEENSSSNNEEGYFAYKLLLNFEDKMVELDLGGSKNIQAEYIGEILEKLGIKYIIAIDSVLVYKDNKIKVSKVFGNKDVEITVENLKTLLEDIDEKVNIQVIKEDL